MEPSYRKPFDRAAFLNVVHRYDSSVLHCVEANLKAGANPKDSATLVSVKAFLQFLSLRKDVPFLRSSDAEASTLPLQLTCVLLAQLVRFFAESKSFVLTASKKDIAPIIDNLPYTWRVLIWLLGQMDLNEIATGSRPGSWLLRQFSDAFNLSKDHTRKIRERALKKLQLEARLRSKDDCIAAVRDHLITSGSTVRLDESRTSDEHRFPAPSVILLRSFFTGCNHADLAVPERCAKEVGEHGLTRISGNCPDKAFELLHRFLETERRETLRFVETRLFHRLGRFTEQLLSTAAWLFRYDDANGSLHADIGHNSDLTASDGGLTLQKGKGIVGHVAESLRPYLASDVGDHPAHPQYVDFNLDTKSELAVPIFYPRTARLLSVINLESKNVDWFTKADAAYVQSLSVTLVPDLIVNAALRCSSSPLGGWHYRQQGWSIDHTISKVCQGISNALREESGIKVATMVWEFDQEKHSFWVRGTSGYDYEYATQQGLPVRSFLGRVFETRKPLYSRSETAPEFLRKFKAAALGVEWVAASPIFAGDMSGSPWGVIAVYGFRVNEGIQLALLQKLANFVGRIVSFWEKVRSDAARAYAFAKISRVPHRGNARNEAARDLLQELLAADGLSVFTSNQANQLACVATTGLETASGPLYSFQEAVYDKAADVGPTVLLAQNPDQVLRRLDASDDEEEINARFLPRKIVFLNRFRETAAWSPRERRRFIGLGIRRSDGSEVVVRAVRRAGRRPYREADGHILSAALRELSESIQAPSGFHGAHSLVPLLRTVPCQIDIKVGALMQQTLIDAKLHNVRSVRLFTATKTLDGKWRTKRLCAQQVGKQHTAEEPIFDDLPSALLQRMLGSKLPELSPVTIECGKEHSILIVPFVVPQFGTGELYLLDVDYDGFVDASDVALWASTSHWLTIAYGLAAKGPDDESVDYGVFSMNGFEAVLNPTDSRHPEHQFWCETPSVNTHHRLAIALGPHWLGYGDSRYPISWWLQILADYLELKPPVECSRASRDAQCEVWQLQPLNRHFASFLGRLDSRAASLTA